MFSQKGFFKISIKREKYSKEHNRIRIATLYSHTRTSWFDRMIFFSLDPLFDLAKYAMQVCLETFPTWAPHKLLEVARKRRQTQNSLVRKQTLEWFESTIWGVHVNYALFKKKSKLLRCENGMRWLCFRAVPFLNRLRRYVSHFTYPAGMRYVLG